MILSPMNPEGANMNEPTRVWPLIGDLCAPRFETGIVYGITKRDREFWAWQSLNDAHVGRVKQEEPVIIVSHVRLAWGRYEGTVRELVYVITPTCIGWDDYGNYNVEVRPHEETL